MKKALLYLGLLVVIGTSVSALTAELNEAAADGFNRYAQLTEQQMNDQIRDGQFLWVDTLPAAEVRFIYSF